ncbi:MAG: flagellar export protein FliJ [Gemmatimonadaceae bacterium]|jgi:flagellar FliJ protein
MFKFRLQRLLELRQEAEQAKARVVASARQVAEAAQREHDALAALRDAAQGEVRSAHQQVTRVGHLQQLGVALTALDERVMMADESVQAAEQVVQEAQDALTIAARDRRVLDRLKEHHVARWQAEEAARDRVQMDEIALGRFGRSADAAQDSLRNDGRTS